ncbi:MAG: YgfZ/GcvT domain-containing protein [Sphingomicrobium sp.]
MPQTSQTATTLTHRALVRVAGEGARDFLQGLVTNDVAGPLPAWAGLLTPQGKCIADFLIWQDPQDDVFLLDCDAEAADLLTRRLGMYRLRRPITIEREERLAVHWALEGEDGVPDPRLAALGRRWLGPPGKPAAGWLEHRLRLGVCEGAAELGDLLWLECNAAELNGVSFTKGCFVGQENTARMNWRAKVNRRLVVVRGDGGNRARVAYPDLGLAVVHARVDAIPDNALIPAWLQPALA